MIMTTLLTAYLNVERSSAWWKKEEQELFTERFFYHRLLEVFTHLEEIDKIKTFFFTSDSNTGLQLPGTTSLVFSYDNGASLDKGLSGSVLGRLFADSHGELILLTWPERELWPEQGLPSFHREVLMKNIKNLELEFFHLPNPLEEGAPAAAWKGSYSKDLTELPGAIKLTITTQDDKTRPYYFPIPQTLSILKEKV
jgi:hypothetical protein